MLYKLERNGKATEYYWQRQDSSFALLGDTADMAKLYDQLGNVDTIPDLPELPPEDAPCYTVPEAVSAALAAGLNTSKRRLGVTIRSAARQGRIAGAYRTPEGYWRLPVAPFNAWLAEHAEQRRGRPRKESADIKAHTWQDTTATVIEGKYTRFRINKTPIDQLDTYTVELWRNRINGEQYAVKRDSTGIAVGAFGPLDFVTNEGVEITDSDWSLDLAHSLQIDRLLGSFEVWSMGE